MEKIIIIDDDPTTVALLQKSLETKGYDVHTCHDGMEGFVRVQEEKPDLIIMDVHMPNLDGYSLVRQIRDDEELKAIPVLVITSDEKLEGRFQKLGIRHYVKKPFDAGKILELVEYMLKITPGRF